MNKQFFCPIAISVVAAISLFSAASAVSAAPEPLIESRFFKLEWADAKDIKEKLTSVLTNKGSITEGAQSTAKDSLASPVETVVDTGNQLFPGKIRVTADKRTNRIHVLTQPHHMVFVAELIKEFDQEAAIKEPAIYQLKFVKAKDIFRVIAKVFSVPTQPGSVRDDSKLRGNQNLPEQEVTLDAITIGAARVIADVHANSIIVLGNRDVKEQIYAILRAIDTPAQSMVSSDEAKQSKASGKE